MIYIKILTSYFMDIDTMILQFKHRGRRPGMTNTVLKKSKNRQLALADINTNHKAIPVKTTRMGVVKEYTLRSVKHKRAQN